MNRTNIEWTDFTANPLKYRDASGRVVWACVHASPGCQHCYAETLAARYHRGGSFNVPTTSTLTPFLDEQELRRMLNYKPAAGKRCFVGDMTDVFGEWVDRDLLDRLFAVFALRGGVTWQVLTKRAERLRAYFGDAETKDRVLRVAIRMAAELDGRPEGGLLHVAFMLEELWAKGRYWPLPNVWLGVSCEDQQRADERVSHLLQTPAMVRFVSAEPLLGPVDLSRLWRPRDIGTADRIDWVIVGGESGPQARRCDRRWIETVVRQCQSAGVPVFVKQMGTSVVDRNDAGFTGDDEDAWPDDISWRDAVEHDLDGTRDGYQGAPVRIHLKSRKGGDPAEWPESLRVRQFPVINR